MEKNVTKIMLIVWLGFGHSQVLTMIPFEDESACALAKSKIVNELNDMSTRLYFSGNKAIAPTDHHQIRCVRVAP